MDTMVLKEGQPDIHNPQAPPAHSKMVVVATETRRLPCHLTLQEQSMAGERAGQLTTERVRRQAALTAYTKEERAQLKSLELQATLLSREAATWTGERDVKCKVVHDYDRGQCLIVRIDTNQIVQERNLTHEEYSQTQMPLVLEPDLVAGPSDDSSNAELGASTRERANGGNGRGEQSAVREIPESLDSLPDDELRSIALVLAYLAAHGGNGVSVERMASAEVLGLTEGALRKALTRAKNAECVEGRHGRGKKWRLTQAGQTIVSQLHPRDL